ncbi:MAG: hypothetical protein UV66_C0005G0006 [Candidatus Woesebacteria bacterium GW2011_GWA1_43_12]|uniref:Transposase IS200-like domain-containing protein n=1 Tax=Candidatus Woesebacteria bacterium GW2011_GWA1_43_12 TaxID=1618557 RepID=A0A0G1CX16_9BACT|nr:MAG: hypothetical protein UV66_C0005G0006 [Candidatus Woesebacteria bacterium GW2011_GWA1_43_12]
MASRMQPLVNGEYYHAFNRGVAKQPVFLTIQDYSQAMLSLDYYQFANPPLKLSRYKRLSSIDKHTFKAKMSETNTKLVDVIAFVLMPNHWHLLLRQVTEGGISQFVGQFSNSYTRYFNTKHSRVGHIFQGTFKSVHVDSQEQLLHLSRYIHLNPYSSSIVKKEQLSEYPWSSLPNYLHGEKTILGLNQVKYKNFVYNHADYAQELERIKHLVIDDS